MRQVSSSLNLILIRCTSWEIDPVLVWTRVLDVRGFNLWFSKIDMVWGLNLLVIASSWYSTTPPKISSQSVGWFGRSIDRKFEFVPRVTFLGAQGDPPSLVRVTHFGTVGWRVTRPLWPGDSVWVCWLAGNPPPMSGWPGWTLSCPFCFRSSSLVLVFDSTTSSHLSRIILRIGRSVVTTWSWWLLEFVWRILGFDFGS